MIYDLNNSEKFIKTCSNTTQCASFSGKMAVILNFSFLLKNEKQKNI